MFYIGPFSSLTLFWIVAIIVLIVVEIMTTALTTIWFVGGGVCALIVTALGANVAVQIAVFVVVSALLLFSVRPFAVKHFNPERSATNVDAVIGKQGIVTAKIDNTAQTGSVRLDGMDWSARTAISAQIIEEGQSVRVESVDGVKLVVRTL